MIRCGEGDEEEDDDNGDGNDFHLQSPAIGPQNLQRRFISSSER